MGTLTPIPLKITLLFKLGDQQCISVHGKQNVNLKCVNCAGLSVGQPIAELAYGAFSEWAVVNAKHALPVPILAPEIIALLTSGLTASIGAAPLLVLYHPGIIELATINQDFLRRPKIMCPKAPLKNLSGALLCNGIA